MTVKFSASKEEHTVMSKIADRALKDIPNYPDDKLSIMMDLDACHSNGMPLMLYDLLHAKPFDFMHDVCGIRRHINRKTGEIGDCFVPRYHMSDGKVDLLIEKAIGGSK